MWPTTKLSSWIHCHPVALQGRLKEASCSNMCVHSQTFVLQELGIAMNFGLGTNPLISSAMLCYTDMN